MRPIVVVVLSCIQKQRGDIVMAYITSHQSNNVWDFRISPLSQLSHTRTTSLTLKPITIAAA